MELLTKLLSTLFPSRCILCQQTVVGSALTPGIELCADCYNSQPFNLSCCLRCALPLADDIDNRTLCGRCISELPAFDYACSLFRYEADIIHLVHQLKFSEKITFARSIGEMLLSEMKENDLPGCLLPVPLHASRLRQRGFNQSIEIARVIAEKYGLPIEVNAVVRRRSTESQTGLNVKQRRKNVKGAFSMSGEIKYKHVLIVDDVMTTGATVNELARVLKRNKVERVGVLSIARAPVKH